MTGRFPWGAGRAPALLCDECNRRIGLHSGHHILHDGDTLLCGRCRVTDSRSRARAMHAKHYPGCPHTWHDMFDHPASHATRAAAWFALTDPEKRRCA